MEPRTFVTFEWGAPDEETVSPDGEVVPAGKGILEAVRLAMAKRGLKSSTLNQHDSYGWCFNTQIGDTAVWSMLQSSDSWLLISEAPVGWLQKLRGRSNAAALMETSKAIHASLSELSLASSIQWFSRKEFMDKKGRGGTSEP